MVFLFLGFIGSIADAKEMEDTVTPLQIHVVCKLSFRYGTSDSERKNSHIFVMVNAFSSRACIDRSFEPIHIGMPVRGVLELTESGCCSAQLVG